MRFLRRLSREKLNPGGGICLIGKVDPEPKQIVSGAMMDSEESIEILNRLTELNHWARVAFAAMCARTVMPLFGEIAANEQVKSRRKLLEAGIEKIENAAEWGEPTIEPDKIKIDLTIARGAARRAVHDRDEESEPTEEEEFGLQLNEEIVDICEEVLETYESPPHDSRGPAFVTFVKIQCLLERLESEHVLDLLIAALEWLELNTSESESPHTGASLNRFREEMM